MRTCSFAALILALAFAPFARADKAPPAPKETSYPLVIEAGPKVTDARLVIPKKMLGTVKAALENESTDQRASILPGMHTVIAGAALAVGLAFGGLWLVRRGSTGSRSLALLLGTVAFLGIGAVVWADIPRPPPPPVMRSDKVIIEITDQGDEVKLVINKDRLAKVLEGNKK